MPISSNAGTRQLLELHIRGSGPSEVHCTPAELSVDEGRSARSQIEPEFFVATRHHGIDVKDVIAGATEPRRDPAGQDARQQGIMATSPSWLFTTGEESKGRSRSQMNSCVLCAEYAFPDSPICAVKSGITLGTSEPHNLHVVYGSPETHPRRGPGSVYPQTPEMPCYPPRTMQWNGITEVADNP